MAFRATNNLPAVNYDEAKSLARQLKNYASSRATLFGSGGNSDQIFATLDALKQFRDRLDAIRSTPGIAQYARDQEDDQTYDVVAEFVAMVAAVDAAIAQIVTTFPADGSGFLLAQTLSADGSRSARSFSAAGLATFVTLLTAIDTAIT